ncbi:glycosyltransferase family 39 protein [Candidatus Saccharibacteria bacterium]|nr:glycosyltransferase family 39 protein [Candidatus Saccharibacteria bacterium]
MRKLWNLALAMGRPFLLTVFALVSIIALMGYKLGSLTPALSEPEVATVQASDSIAEIFENPVNGPYKIVMYVVTRVTTKTIAIRMISALVGAIAIVLFFLISRKFMRTNIALAASLMFGTSSLLLHYARLATTDIMLLSLLVLVGVGYLLRFDKHVLPVWLLACFVIGASLYVPGLVIFIILGAIWQLRRVRQSFNQLSPLAIAACALIFSILSMPFVVSLIRDPNTWRAFLGLQSMFESVPEIFKEIGQVILSIFVISPNDPVYWLGKQPMLDIFTSVMFLYGLFAVTRYYKLDRIWVLAGVFLVAIIWIGLSANHHTIIVLLPFIYFVVGYGIELLIDQWFDVFPRNPIARWLGIILLISVIGSAVNFNLQRYFIAWPNNQATKSAFTSKL